MDTQRRLKIYSQNGKVTHAQRRRIVKKAGRDPGAIVTRDDGMGYPPGMQGYRELVVCGIRPVSGAPVGTGRGHEMVDAIIDEPY